LFTFPDYPIYHPIDNKYSLGNNDQKRLYQRRNIINSNKDTDTLVDPNHIIKRLERRDIIREWLKTIL
jgi:hypothetical protein